MAKKVHLIAESKNVLDKGRTLCGVPLKSYMHGLEFETDKQMFLDHWDKSVRCKKCESLLTKSL